MSRKSSRSSHIDRDIAKIIAQKESIPIRKKIDETEGHKHSIAEAPAAKHVINGIILLNVIQMGMALDLKGPGWQIGFYCFDVFVMATFTLEMLALIVTHGVAYFHKAANLIDFFVVIVSGADLLMKMTSYSYEIVSVIHILRLLRLVRIAKLLRVFPQFQVILESMHASFITISWFILFLGIIIYVGAIICVILFGSPESGFPGFDDDAAALKNEDLESFNNYRYFGTIWRATLSLFNLALLSELTEILRPINAGLPWATMFLAVFILVMTLCILNSVVGVVVQKTVEAILAHEQKDVRTKKNQLHALHALADILSQLDTDGSEQISMEEMQAGSDNAFLFKVLRDIDFPAGFTLEDLFSLLDIDGSGVLSRNEFIGGLFRLLFSNEFQRQCLARLGEANLRQTIMIVKDEIKQEIHLGNQRLVQEMQELLAPLGCEKRAVHYEPSCDARVAEKFHKQRTYRQRAYQVAAEEIPELANAFTSSAPNASKKTRSSEQKGDAGSKISSPCSSRSSPQSSEFHDTQNKDCANSFDLSRDGCRTELSASEEQNALPPECQLPVIPASVRTKSVTMKPRVDFVQQLPMFLSHLEGHAYSCQPGSSQ